MALKQSSWSELRQAVLGCTACQIRQEAVRPVPGIGPTNTGIVFVGRNPGIIEDLQGNPFIGPAGQALDQLFFPVCGLTRQNIFLTNLVLCHTIGDEEPSLDVVKICIGQHLFKQLPLLSPFLVVTFGALPAFTLVGALTISREHGRLFKSKRGFYIIPCLHPGAALYKPSLRDEVKQDAKQVRRFLANKERYMESLKVWVEQNAINGRDQTTLG